MSLFGTPRLAANTARSSPLQVYVQTRDGEDRLDLNPDTYAVTARESLHNDQPAAVDNAFVQGPAAASSPLPTATLATVIATIPVLSSPHGISVNPTTNRIYVTALQSGKLLTLDGTTNEVLRTITVGADPHSVAVNASTDHVFVSNNLGSSMSVVDGSSGNLINTVSGLATYPIGVAVDAMRNLIYVAHGASKLSVIDGLTNLIVGVIDTGASNAYVAVNATTRHAYVAKNPPGTVAVIDLSTNTKTTDIPVGGSIDGVAVNSSTNRIYIANHATNMLVVIDGVTNAILSSVAVGAGPTDVAVNPTSNCIYVANASGNSISIINGATNRVAGTVSVGSDPKSISVNPVTGRVYVANRGSNTVSVIQDSACGNTAQPRSIFNKKVYVLVYDPILSNGQALSANLGWNHHPAITQQTIDLFRKASNNRMNYTVVYTTVVTDGWPDLVDGYRYNESSYMAAIQNDSLAHRYTDGNYVMVDYRKIVNTPAWDICGKVNRGDIDELWIYNGPYFGFYESQLVGPNAYVYNSPPITSGTSCNRLLPIMGPSPQASSPNAVHNFGHRTEATMSQIYGSWEQNRTAHSWERFALTMSQSPSYSYSGCGNTHFPPNATQGYQYDSAAIVNSNCNDFANYPNLRAPLSAAQPTSCAAWGCTDLGYYGYWFSHLPSAAGCAPDGFANDWWLYFANPELALTPAAPCSRDVFLPAVRR